MKYGYMRNILAKSLLRPMLLGIPLAVQACGKYDLDEALVHNARIKSDLTKITSRVALRDTLQQDIDLACAIAPFADVKAIAVFIGDEGLAKSRIWIPIGDESWTLAYRSRSGKKWDYVAFAYEPGSLVLDRSRYRNYKDACIRAPAYLEVVRDGLESSRATKVVLAN